MTLTFVGRLEEAIASSKKAMRLNPMPPNWYFADLAHTYRLTGQYEEAIVTLRKALQRNPDDLIAHIILATSYVMGGQEDEARAEATEVLRIDPKFSLEYFAKTLPYKNQADIKLFVESMRKAGLK